MSLGCEVAPCTVRLVVIDLMSNSTEMELVINYCQVERKEAAVSVFRSFKTWDKFEMIL